MTRHVSDSFALLNRRRFLQQSALTGTLAMTIGRLSLGGAIAAPGIDP